MRVQDEEFGKISGVKIHADGLTIERARCNGT